MKTIPWFSLCFAIATMALGGAAVAQGTPKFTAPAAVAAQSKRTQTIAQARNHFANTLRVVQRDVMRAGELDEANRAARLIENPDDPAAPALTSLRGKAAQAAYRAAVQRANAEYVVSLKSALNASMRSGQLEESNHIAAEIKAIEGAAGAAATVGVAAPLSAPAASGGAVTSTAGFINLLPLIDPEKHTVQGTWTFEKGALVSSGKGEERIEIPYEAPEEYDYQITFTKVGTNCVVQNLVGNGTPFIWVMGNSGTFTFHYLKNAGIGPNKTTVKERSGISDKRRYVSLVKVRKNGVEAFLNGKRISKWETDFSDAVPSGFWALRNRKCLGIGTGDTKATIQAVEVKEITGTGVQR